MFSFEIGRWYDIGEGTEIMKVAEGWVILKYNDVGMCFIPDKDHSCEMPFMDRYIEQKERLR